MQKARKFRSALLSSLALNMVALPLFAADLHWQSYEQPGYLATKANELQAVELVLTKHLEKVNSQPHPDDATVISLLEKLINTCANEAHYDQAHEYCQIAIRFSQRGTDKLKTAHLLLKQANLETKQNKLTQAELSYDRAKSLLVGMSNDNAEVRHCRAQLLFAYADLKTREHSYASAGQLFKDALTTLKPQESLSTSNLSRYARYLYETGDAKHIAQAKNELLAVLQADQEQFGEKSPPLAATLNNLAVVSAKQNNWPKAEAYMKDALEISRKWHYADLAAWIENMSEIYSQEKKVDEAERLRTEAQALRKAKIASN